MTDFKIDFLESYDQDSIVEELKRIASVTGKATVTKNDIKTHGRCKHATILRRFGSLRKALHTAGLASQRYMKGSDEELLSILIELWEQTLESEGRRPYKEDLKKYKFPVSPDTYVRHFGSWKKALLLAYNSVASASEDFEAHGNQALPSAEKSRKRENLSIRKRFFVMKRDHFACVKCSASGYGVRLEVDHIVPFAKGGTDALDNLQTLCFDCNRGKRDDLE
jgi:hypothetical protein